MSTETTEFSYDTLKRFCEEACQTRASQIECRDRRTSEVHLFHAEGGIHQFVRSELRRSGHPRHRRREGVADGVSVEFAISTTRATRKTCIPSRTFARKGRAVRTLPEFKTADPRHQQLHQVADLTKKMKGRPFPGDVIEEADRRAGVKLPQPQFEARPDQKLGNGEVAGIVGRRGVRQARHYFQENPKDARLIIDKAVDASAPAMRPAAPRSLSAARCPFGQRAARQAGRLPEQGPGGFRTVHRGR